MSAVITKAVAILGVTEKGMESETGCHCAAGCVHCASPSQVLHVLLVAVSRGQGTMEKELQGLHSRTSRT